MAPSFVESPDHQFHKNIVPGVKVHLLPLIKPISNVIKAEVISEIPSELENMKAQQMFTCAFPKFASALDQGFISEKFANLLFNYDGNVASWWKLQMSTKGVVLLLDTCAIIFIWSGKQNAFEIRQINVQLIKSLEELVPYVLQHRVTEREPCFLLTLSFQYLSCDYIKNVAYCIIIVNDYILLGCHANASTAPK